jgi:hypothetical protein
MRSRLQRPFSEERKLITLESSFLCHALESAFHAVMRYMVAFSLIRNLVSRDYFSPYPEASVEHEDGCIFSCKFDAFNTKRDAILTVGSVLVRTNSCSLV